MIRFDCLKLLEPRITDQLVVTSLSGQKIEWASLSQHPGNLLVGTMGTALGVGIGLAIGLPQRKVIVLESDGSVLLSLFNSGHTRQSRSEESDRLCLRQPSLQRHAHQRADRHRGQNRSHDDGARRGHRTGNDRARSRDL